MLHLSSPIQTCVCFTFVLQDLLTMNFAQFLNQTYFNTTSNKLIYVWLWLF